jgi:hypothetical protein
MDKLKRIHRDNDQLNFKEIWKNGTFIFDSNVLLDLYRLPKSAREDLINILKSDKFKGRIWIGFQVILEFLNNRYEAISDQKNKFHSVRTIVEDAIEHYDELIGNLNSELAKLKLKQRHSLIDPDKFINPTNIQNGVKYLNDFIENLETLETKQSDVNESDKLKDLVLELFDGKIGAGFDKKKLSEIYKEADKRYDAKIPPGYKDIKKEGAHLYEEKEYIRKYGDLILWKEILEKAKAEKLKYVVLITGDVKEDWWFEKRGKKLGPRNELLNEIYHEAPDLDTFFMYDTSSFLLYAKKELELNVKESSISETKELIELVRQTRLVDEEGKIYLPDFLRELSKRFPLLKLGIGKSVKALPLLNFNTRLISTALIEIFYNVVHHGRDNYVGIQAKELGSNILLRFKNLKHTEIDNKPTESINRGKGIDYIKSILAKEGIDTHIGADEKRFWVELYIPIKTREGTSIINT